jgi:hypothetical protein
MKLKGYVALTTVVVMLPLLLITGINGIYRNLTSLIIGRMNYDYQILETNAQTCLEESVYKIKWEVDYTGTFTIDMTDWSCTSTVTNKDLEPGVKTIELELLDKDSNITKSIVKELNSNTNPFELKNT